MRDSHFTPRIFKQFIDRFSGNSKKSVLNPHDIDELVDRINALSNVTVQVGTKNQSHIGTQGMILEINVPSADAGGGANLTPFAITALGDSDFFTARKLSNLQLVGGLPTFTVGVTDIKIAKPATIRRSVLSEKIDGVDITYRDTGGSDNDNNRIANDGSTDESQCVYPRYITLTDLGFAGTVTATAQCVIYACQSGRLAGVFDAGNNPVDWLEVLPARVWAKRFAP